MDATLEIETRYVVRLTRFEAARALVAPGDLQAALRGLLQADEGHEDAKSTEPRGQLTAPPALSARSLLALPATRKAMRKLRAGTRRKPCPHCGGEFRKLGIHIAKAHPRKAEPVAVEDENNGHG